MAPKVVIADDEPHGLKRLKTACLSLSTVEIVGEARSGFELLELVSTLAPDIVVTDIEMPGMTGIEASSRFPSPRPELVFVTAHDRFAVLAFHMDVADYLLKPILPDRLKEALTRAIRRRALANVDWTTANAKPDLPKPGFSDIGIWVPSRAGQIRVSADAIDWVEAAGDYALIHTAVRSYLLRATLGSLEAELQGTGIRRVHRCALVKTGKVVELAREGRSYSVILRDGAMVQVGGSYLADLKLDLGII